MSWRQELFDFFLLFHFIIYWVSNLHSPAPVQVGQIQDHKHVHLSWDFYEYEKLIKVFTNLSGILT